MERSVWIGLFLAIAWLAAAPARAQEADAQPPAAVAADADTAAALQRLEQNAKRANDARARLVALEAEYSRGMADHNLDGDRRVAVVNGIASAKQELAEARAAHPMLVAQARRAGASQEAIDSYPLPPPVAPANPGSTDLDDANAASAEDLDRADTGTSEDADQADTGASEDADAADTGASKGLDSVDRGRPHDLDAVDGGASESPGDGE